MEFFIDRLSQDFSFRERRSLGCPPGLTAEAGRREIVEP